MSDVRLNSNKGEFKDDFNRLKRFVEKEYEMTVTEFWTHTH